MDADGPCKLSENIHIGMKVKIQRKRTKKILEGIITEILDDNQYNLNGLEVEIDDCFEGNVKNIMEDKPIISSSELCKKIDKHESKFFEIKSSFKYDVNISNHIGVPTANEALRRKIVEEVASFMNTCGGIVCIGVDDDKNILGLENDYKLQSGYTPDKDKSLLQGNLKLEIIQALIDYLDTEMIFTLYDVEIITIDGKDVCCIIVKKSNDPIFVKMKISAKIDGKDKTVVLWKCWMRIDNSIRCIDFDSFLKLWMTRN